jgi:hypothetical protein
MLKMIRILSLSAFFVSLSFIQSFGQTDLLIPKIIEKNGRHTLLVDGKPFFILGGQAHNSSAWPGMLPQVFSAIKELHANTLEIPIYWEQIEPVQGKFDFSLIDTILLQSRKQKVRVVLLWFATWKNGSNHYMPEWMKRDAEKYPNIVRENGSHVDSPSPNFIATLEADKKAFAAVMRYLKKADKQHTVIMMQVENEPGAWGSVRDYSDSAQALFKQEVPKELLEPSLLKQLNISDSTPVTGNWQKAFGERADEYFQAWSVARFIEQVTAAGKAEYALPMYVNAALRNPLTNPTADSYESGGPTDNVIPIWKVAAPSIDLLAPDIYENGSEKILKVMDLYARADNPLFVPEASFTLDKAKYLYQVFAKSGIGFAPFGVDDNNQSSNKDYVSNRIAPFAQEYAIVAPMMRELAQWSFDGKIKVVFEKEDNGDQKIELGNWQATVFFGGDGRANAAPIHSKPIGKLMIIELDENKFLLVGSDCHITFTPIGKNKGHQWQYGKVEEGNYENGKFKMLRIQNGDETDWGGPGFGKRTSVLQTTLIVR